MNPTDPPAVVVTEAPPIAGGAVPQARPDCTARSRTGERCYKRHPADMGRWCDSCSDDHDPAGPLPEWMGGEGPRPSAIEEFNPSPIEEAEILGHSLGRDGIAAVRRADCTVEEREAFQRGLAAGFREFEADEYDR